MKVIVTGGAGYIGSHTILELVELGVKKIVSIDNFINSTPESYDRIERICGMSIESHDIDLSDKEALLRFFRTRHFDGIIHFAALKSVPESVEVPTLYYRNNINALINLLEAMKRTDINNLIFSSSCSVYGSPDKLPVTEKTPYGLIESPYANTKKIGEEIIRDFCKVHPEKKVLSLRYFNPAGAHKSGLIGEIKTKRPNNLIPIIAQQAIGIRDQFTVYGSDYKTRDGSCIRDYVHVSDIARAHALALNYINEMGGNFDVINLGSGKGSTTLEVIRAFEKFNNISLNYRIGERRTGDVASIYANNEKAKKLLKWTPEMDLKDIVKSAWKWQQNADQ